MTINLVTTPFVNTFSKKNENLIIGKWCLKNLNKTNDNFLISEAPYHWAKESKIKKDYDYLKKFYYRSITNFSSFLNNYHGVDKPERYWHIIIGPFLVNFIPLIWDRWETIRNLSDEGFQTTVLDNTDGVPVFEDFKDFFMSFNDNYWNHLIYIEIIKLLKDKNFTYEIKKINYSKKLSEKKNNLFASFFGHLLNPFLKNNKYLLYDVAFNKVNYFNLSLKLKQIPTINTCFDRKIFKNTPIKRDKLKIIESVNDQFENFCNKLIIKNLPKTYLENYKKVKDQIDQISFNPKKIITSYAHINNDNFKIWASEKVLKGNKLIITDHGGYIDESSHFNSMEKYSDIYFKWNKSDLASTKQVPPSLFLKRRKTLKASELGKKILFLTHNCHLYPYRIGPSPISTLMVDEQNIWINFLKKINKENLIVRIHPGDNWNFKKIFLLNFEKKMLSTKKKFSQEIKLSKLIINTTPQTTFIESMKSGVPTILVTKGYTVDVSTPIKRVLKDLKDNKIFFNNFDEALNHINQIYDDPLSWWNSKQIQKVRENFAASCSLETKNNLNFWAESLKKV